MPSTESTNPYSGGREPGALHRVFSGGTVVADHERIWAKHQTISDPEHVAAAAVLRRGRFEVIGAPAHVEVEQRALSDYDTLLGLDGPVA